MKRTNSLPVLGMVPLLVAVFATPSLGQSPSAVATKGHGLAIGADWWNATSAQGGYFPVHAQITNLTPRPRTLRVAVETQGYPSKATTSQQVEVPGNSAVDVTLSVPLTSANAWGSLMFYERGRRLDNLTIGGVGATSWWGSEAMPSVLLIGAFAPDVRYFEDAARRMAGGSGTQGNYQPNIQPRDLLPTRWIDYSMLDLVMVPLRELEQMSQPTRDALITWTLAGGNLFVFGVSEPREDNSALKRLLDIDHRPPAGATWDKPQPEDRQFHAPDPSGQQTAWSWNGRRRVRTRIQQPPGKAASVDAADKASVANAPTPNFSVRQFGLGQVIASSTVDPFPGELADWAWLFNSIGPDSFYWHDRHGITPRGQNDDFWNFLIPGVGRAPVGAFQILITVFAIMIGPVNYMVLRRQKRLYLLIITVPAFAVLTAVTLLGYAIASDGFGVRTRVRSVTMLDQKRREAISWTRASYYAGLTPAGGLRFSADTAVYPIDQPERRPSDRSLDWTEDQHMTNGWLRARTPTQLLTVGFKPTDDHVAVAVADGAARVTNQLGTPIRLIVVAGSSGEWYAAKDLANGDSVRLEPEELAEIHVDLRKLITAQVLDLPDEMTNTSEGFGIFGSRYYSYYGTQWASAWNTSVLERMLNGLRGDANLLQALVTPGSYVAIVDRAPMVELGVSRSDDAGSLYVILGNY
jgi:hypothetical protein